MSALCSSRNVFRRVDLLFALLVAALVLLVGCGSGSGGGPGGKPSFTSTPGTSATEGTAYTYQIEAAAGADPATLTLTAAPSGATLQGNTLSWTPTAAESRVADQFVVTATNSMGSATQSWIVTPSGTIMGSRVDTYWTPSGPVRVPFNWTAPIGNLGLPAALVPQTDGSFQTLSATGNADGTFTISNVPGGYYWLELGGFFYWTSSSTFDLGRDVPGTPPSAASNTGSSQTTTTVNVNFSGLNPLQAQDEIEFAWDASPGIEGTFRAQQSAAGATTLSESIKMNTNANFSQSGPAFALQYEPQSVGILSIYGLGAEGTLQNLSISTGATNTIGMVLASSQQESFDLNVRGSAWASLFNNVAPTTPTLEGADLGFRAWSSYVTGSPVAGLQLPLVWDAPIYPDGTFTSGFGIVFDGASAGSASGPVLPGSFAPLPGEMPIVTDEDFGPVSYGDPFPSAWPRGFSFSETASVPIPLPGSGTPITFDLVAAEATASPAPQISPLIGQVQNPAINGMSLFSPATVSSKGVILSWTAPVGAAPTGYEIRAYDGTTLPNGTAAYINAETLYTAKTSVALPALIAGKTYVFVISSILDGAANFETQPNRSALPTASVSVVSAPILVNSGS